MLTTFAELVARRDEYPETVAFTGGAFDGLHEGHVAGVKFAKEQAGPGGLLMVGVMPNKLVRERKGFERPVFKIMGRLAVVEAIRYVDVCFEMPMPTDELTSTMQVLQGIRPNIYVEHAEHAGRWSDNEKAALAEMGITFVVDEGPKIESTSWVVDRMQAAAVAARISDGIRE